MRFNQNIVSQILANIRLVTSNVNKGGCGLFANLLYKILDKCGLKPQIMFIESEKCLKYIRRESKKVIENNEYEDAWDLTPEHIVMYVPDWKLFIDGLSMRTYWVGEGLSIAEFPKEVLDMLLIHGLWNKNFQDHEILKGIFKTYKVC